VPDLSVPHALKPPDGEYIDRRTARTDLNRCWDPELGSFSQRPQWINAPISATRSSVDRTDDGVHFVVINTDDHRRQAMLSNCRVALDFRCREPLVIQEL